MGRTRKHDRERLGTQLCERLARGELLKNICDDLGIAPHTPWRWATDDPDGFGKAYARAREDQAHAIADQAMTIADEEVVDAVASARNRLRVDTRKWLASKIAPRSYGDRTQHEVSGADGGPLVVKVVRE